MAKQAKRETDSNVAVLALPSFAIGAYIPHLYKNLNFKISPFEIFGETQVGRKWTLYLAQTIIRTLQVIAQSIAKEKPC